MRLTSRPWFVGVLLAVPAFVGGFTYPGSPKAEPPIVMTRAELDKHDADIRIQTARQVLDARAEEGACWMGWKAQPRKKS